MPTQPGPKRVFTYAEALASFPDVQRLTRAAAGQVEALVNQLQSLDEMESRRGEIEEACEEIIRTWAAEISERGCEVKGLWLVDWDSGDGYYCWRYPEAALSHYHGYEDGFAGRVPIQ